QNGDPKVFPDVKFGGADKVADVFHKQHVQSVQIKVRQNVLNAHRLNVARAVRVELDGGNAQGGDFFRVNLPRDIPFDDADGKGIAKLRDQGGDKACLSRAGTSHDVDQTDPFFPQQG